MAINEIQYTLNSNNRRDIRRELIELFLSEENGQGTGELSSRYWYTVENYADSSIVLKRPAILNKGFDFTVNIDNIYFKGNKKRRHTNPCHDDIVDILSHVKATYPSEYERVVLQVKNIFEMIEYNFHEIEHMEFIDGDDVKHPVGIALLAIKWLFIEQDITYWNWSGRNKLMNGLEEKGLV